MKKVTLTSIVTIALFHLSVASAASASETITYTYDAKGRLIKVERSGTVNNGVDTEYQHDDADNRINIETTGSSNP